MKSTTLLILAVMGQIAATCASAAPARVKTADDFSLPSGNGSLFETDTADVFGFSDGTDTNSQGEREFSGTLQGRFGKRVLNPQNDPPGKGTYRILAPQFSLQYGLTDDFEVEGSVFVDSRHVRNVPDMNNNSQSQFNGGSLQLKYRLLERTRENPFGVAVSFEPRYSRVNDYDARRKDSFGGETRLIWDLRVLDAKLWYGGNLAYEPTVGKFRDTGQYERQSGISLSQALSMRILDNFYAGVEAIYSRQYDGVLFKTYQTQALSVGPTFQYKVSKNFFISGAWQMQVWGREKGDSQHNLDLNGYERHYAKLKLGMNF